MRFAWVFQLCFLGIGLGQTPEPARVILEDSLKDKNPDNRKQAVESLGLVGPREPYLTLLEGMLDDKDVEVRLATITSLMDLKNKRTVSSDISSKMCRNSPISPRRCFSSAHWGCLMP